MKMHYLQDITETVEAAEDMDAVENIDIDAIEAYCHEEPTSSYITYSTTFIDSNNILVFEDPVEQVIHIEDIMGKTALSVFE